MHDDDFNVDIMVSKRRELLNIHHNRAVTREKHNIFVGTGQFRAHSRGKSESHGSEASGSQKLARLACFEELSRPHLMLTDIRDRNRVFVAQIADFRDKCARFYRIILIFPAERVFVAFFDGLRLPRGKFFDKIRLRAFNFV